MFCIVSSIFFVDLYNILIFSAMVKLVGVLGDDEPPSHCSARRLMPLNIEADLTMVMAVDDYCMACDVEPCGGSSRYLHNHDWCNFLKNYRR